MTFPRLMLGALCLFLLLPFGAVEFTSATNMAKQGNFSASYTANQSSNVGRNKTYGPPNEIGVLREVSVKRFGVAGPNVQRTYFSLGATDGPLKPAVVLLHGAGRDGRSMLDMWSVLAEREDIVLLAPNAIRSSSWSLLEDTHFVAKALLDDASKHHPINPENVVLIGHSMGGKFALRLANYGIGRWSAVSVHAASLWQNTIWPARRPVPIHLQVGEGDALFSPDAVNKTARRLAKAGHDTSVQVVAGHDHWYYALGPQLAQDAWFSVSGFNTPGNKF